MDCGNTNPETVHAPEKIENTKDNKTSRIKREEPNEYQNIDQDDSRIKGKEPNEYQKIDQHVRKAPKRLKNSAKELVEYMSLASTDPRMLARGFFVWCTENIRYDVDGYFGKTDRAPTDAESVMRNGKSVCEGYARVFELLCSKVGIPVKKLSGFAKGYRYSPTETFSFETKTNHAWNAVQLEGKWYLLDCTWGSGKLDCETKEFKKAFNDYYFLTEPKQFLNAHFPYMDHDLQKSEKWQLLTMPLSLDEFNKSINYRPQAYKLGVQAISHTQPYFEMKNEFEMSFKSTKVEIELTAKLEKENNLKEQVKATYCYQENGIYKILVHPRQTGMYTLKIFGKLALDETDRLSTIMEYKFKCNEVSNECHQYPNSNPTASRLGIKAISHMQPYFEMKNEVQMTFKCFEKDEIKITAILKFEEENQSNEQVNATYCYQENGIYKILVHPRKTGMYTLKIFGKLALDETDRLSTIMEYKFKCNEVSNECHQYPNSNPTASRLGIKAISHMQPYFEMKNEVQMTFKCFEKDEIKITAILKFEEENQSNEQVNATFCYQKNEFYNILVHPRKTGMYTLNIFRKQASDETNSSSWVKGYKFKCTEVSDKCHQYPRSNPPALKLGVKAVSHTQPFFEMKNELQMIFKCFGTDDIKLTAALKFGGEKQNNTTFCYQENDLYKILVHPRKTGLYTLDIYRKLASDEESKSSSWVMGYTLKCTEVTDKNHEYPEIYGTAFAEKCFLHEPMSGNLPARTNIQFCISTPYLQHVMVKSPHTQDHTHLNKQGTMFKGKVVTPEKGHNVQIFGTRGDKHSSMKGLFKFNTI